MTAVERIVQPPMTVRAPDQTLGELRDAVERLVQLHSPALYLPADMIPSPIFEEWSAPSHAFPWGYAPRWRFVWGPTSFTAELRAPWGEVLYRQEVRIEAVPVEKRAPTCPPAIPPGPVSS